MRNHVRHSRSDRSQPAFEEGHEREFVLAVLPELEDEDAADAEDADEAFEDELREVVRLSCPDCARPISVFADETSLPEHALCASPWNPFGLTVCGGSGRPVDEARPVDGFATGGGEQELASLLTLPDGLDWRTQPFSHVGGPGSRPLRVPVPRELETAPIESAPRTSPRRRPAHRVAA
ncbi:hypothetical protein AB0M29_31665 [Streptomyces sp. NPDC051976]|uniref:hypothetical protein n=1 Tax=Streptomyces sp. NPDC051976 TaxID=3154947 RepID=UPI00342EB976